MKSTTMQQQRSRLSVTLVASRKKQTNKQILPSFFSRTLPSSCSSYHPFTVCNHRVLSRKQPGRGAHPKQEMMGSRNLAAKRSSSTATTPTDHLWSCGLASAAPTSLFHHLFEKAQQQQQQQNGSPFHLLRDDEDHEYQETASNDSCAGNNTAAETTTNHGQWRDAMKRLVKECRRSSCHRARKTASIHCWNCCSPAPATNTFSYDAASYFKNFDDGCPDDHNHPGITPPSVTSSSSHP